MIKSKKDKLKLISSNVNSVRKSHFAMIATFCNT